VTNVVALAGQILVYQEEAYGSVQESEVAAAQREATQAVFTSIKAGQSTGLFYIMLASSNVVVFYYSASKTINLSL
jgi:hypothetical protein